MRSMFEQVYTDLQDEKFKIARKAWEVLDREGIADIVSDGYVFWFEHYASGNDCPQSVYDYLKKFMKRKYKLTYLTDTIKLYRGFVLRMCNDGQSWDVLHEDPNGHHLITIAGSYWKAVKWVDEWHAKYKTCNK